MHRYMLTARVAVSRLENHKHAHERLTCVCEEELGGKITFQIERKRGALLFPSSLPRAISPTRERESASFCPVFFYFRGQRGDFALLQRVYVLFFMSLCEALMRFTLSSFLDVFFSCGLRIELVSKICSWCDSCICNLIIF